MMIKAKEWNALNESEKFAFVLGAYMNTLGKRIMRKLKRGE